MNNFMKKFLMIAMVFSLASTPSVSAETWGEWFKDYSFRTWHTSANTCYDLFEDVRCGVSNFLWRNRLHPQNYDPVLIRNFSIVTIALAMIVLPQLVGGDAGVAIGENETAEEFFPDETVGSWLPEAFVKSLRNQESLVQAYELIGEQCCVVFKGAENALLACVDFESVKEVFQRQGIDISESALAACAAFWEAYFES